MNKKIIMVATLAMALLLCTGCGKKLTCTGEMMGGDTEVVTKFSGDKAKSMKFEIKMDMADYGVENEDDVKEAVEEMKKEYEDNDDYENVKVTSKGTVITISFEQEAPEDDAPTYDELKKEMEQSGLTCK